MVVILIALLLAFVAGVTKEKSQYITLAMEAIPEPSHKCE